MADGGGAKPGAHLPEHVRRAIYGEDTAEDKAKALNTDLKRWWGAYAERKADDEDEVHANTLTYDKRTLPRMAPAPTFLPEAETGKK